MASRSRKQARDAKRFEERSWDEYEERRKRGEGAIVQMGYRPKPKDETPDKWTEGELREGFGK